MLFSDLLLPTLSNIFNNYICGYLIVFLCRQVGRSVDETLRLVQAFQYTDKHGEVCPAGWKPGSDTIVPDPKEKLDYFTKHDEEGPDSPKDEM